MSAAALQDLLRFLTSDAKIPLATALKGVPALQKANLDTITAIAQSSAQTSLATIFPEEKQAKQIHSAAKRVSKKRASAEDSVSAPASKKKKANPSQSIGEGGDPEGEEDLEESLALPSSDLSEADLATKVLITNRAPLVLAFVVTLLKYTQPSQPLSSRLSLAQGYVGVTSRARAISLGIEKGVTAEDEGFGEGQPIVKILGKEIRVLRRWGYEWSKKGNRVSEDKNVDCQAVDEDQSTWKAAEPALDAPHDGEDRAAADAHAEDANLKQEQEESDEPALWALDLEALKKSNVQNDPIVQHQNPSKPSHSSAQAHLPIYTPQSARSYLLKAFATAPTETEEDGSTATVTGSNTSKSGASRQTSSASKTAKAQKEEKESNLGMLLQAIDMLYESWSSVLSPSEMDGRTWGWYVRVRPDVLPGAAGWGGRGEVKLGEILALRRTND